MRESSCQRQRGPAVIQGEGEVAMSELLHFHLLGRFAVSLNGLAIDGIKAARLQSLLGYLVLFGEVPLSRQRLAFMYWPETNEDQARTNLRRLIYQIRHDHPALAACLRNPGGRLAWGLDVTVRADVLEFQAARQRGDEARVVESYGGDLLPECDEDWVLDERRHLQDVMVDALRHYAERLEQQGQYEAAIAVVQRRLTLDPLHEDVYRKLMQLHVAAGDRGAAARAYRSLEDRLSRELGVGPSLPTRQLLRQILQLDQAAPPLIEGGLWPTGDRDLPAQALQARTAPQMATTVALSS